MLANLLRPAAQRPLPAFTLASRARARPVPAHTRGLSATAPACAPSNAAMAEVLDVLGNEIGEFGNDAEDLPTTFQLQSNALTREQYIKGLEPGQFLAHYHYSHKYATRPPPRRRAPKLAPSAPKARYGDVFRQLGINPVRECKNASLMSNFVTHMGKVRPRNETGLSWRSQRLVGKALRRAKMMGVIPVLSKGRTSTQTKNKRETEYMNRA